MSSFDAYVSGTASNDDIKLMTSTANNIINTGAGNDVIRSGSGDDRLIGGAGSDILSGGAGADQFYFSASDVAANHTDTDRIVDLNFGDGDTIVFNSYGAGFFSDAAGINAFAGGSSAQISSYAGLANLVADSANVTASGNAALDLLIVTISYGTGQTEIIRISNGYDDYVAAGGVF